MEKLPTDPLLNFPPNLLEDVRTMFDLNKPGAMDKALDILVAWIQTQNHFTQKCFDRHYLERILISTKGSVERAKQRLDKLFTLRTHVTNFFMVYDARTDFEYIQDRITYVPLPTLTLPDFSRVMLCRVDSDILNSKLYLNGYRFTLLLSEYMRAHDYAPSMHLVIDYRTVNVGEMIARADLGELRQGVTAQIEGYGIRLKSINIITTSKLADALITIAKSCVSEKISKRLHVVKDLEELYKIVPKNVFPKDYGGEEDRTLAELHAEWMKVLGQQEFRDYWKKTLEAKTNENLRPKDTFNEQYMGMPGTFRTLSVD